MAKAITTIIRRELTTEQCQAEGLAAVTEALANHAESVAAFIKMIDALHSSGTLALMTALLEQAPGVIQILAQQAEKPEGIKVLGNVIGLLPLLSSLDVTALARMSDAASQAFGSHDGSGHGGETSTSSAGGKPLGVFGLLGLMRDPEVSAGIQRMMEFVKVAGRA